MLDGVLLTELGTDEVDKPTEKNAAVTASVIFTPGRATDADIGRAAMTPATEKHPVTWCSAVGGRWSYGGERAGCSQRSNRR